MSQQKTVVCFGAGPAFKGGMSNYNTSLAKSLNEFEDVKVHVVSWLHQYPSIIPREFKDKVSKLDFLDGSDISIKYLLNYNNPLSWATTAKYIASLNPDQVIIQWSIAIQGLPLGQMIRKLKKISDCEVILDMHFVIQKERSKIDEILTKRGIAQADTFIVHALETYRELQQVYPGREFHLTEDGDRGDGSATPVIKLFHPIYDLYQPDPDFDLTAFKKEHGLKEHVFLFFGFIRKYKGLHNAIEAFKIVADQRDDVSFMICGELFWNTLPDGFVAKAKSAIFGAAKKVFLNSSESEQQYNPLPMVEELGLADKTLVVSEFIPNEDVNKYFQAADSVVLFYSRATPSGIESLSYNFNVPILATRVGHFPETIQEGKNGYMVRENTVTEMAATMMRSLEEPIPPANVDAFKDNLSWRRYSEAILAGVRG
jgi:glycosyltransferase involved in cell wall biosynthesis